MNIKRAFLAATAVLMLPGFAMAQSTLTFDTSITFADTNDATVTATLTCNNGVPLVQSLAISPGQGVNFVINEFELDNEAYSCEIEITGITGYGAAASANTYNTGSTCLFDSVDDEGFFDNMLVTNTCAFVMTAAPVLVSITKKWETSSGAGGNTVDTNIDIKVSSDVEINVTGEYDYCDYNHELTNGNGSMPMYCVMLPFSGDQTRTVSVVPEFGGNTVYIEEMGEDSSVESVNGCGGSVPVAPAVGGSCLITNTVFFEGIPTLNQYGLAIMVLLMLGVGFVGFRRFV